MYEKKESLQKSTQNAIDSFYHHIFKVTPDSENVVYMPNNTIQKCIDNKDKFKKGTDMLRSFPYLFVVAHTYVYNHNYLLQDTTKSINKALKELAGWSFKDYKFEYIIKKNGVLDKINMTQTISVKDLPYGTSIEYGKMVFIHDEIETYEMNCPNANFKKPLFMFDNIDSNVIELNYTKHRVMFVREFFYWRYVLKLKPEIIGFLMYLIYISDGYDDTVNFNINYVADTLGISRRTVINYIDKLKKNNVLEITEKGNNLKKKSSAYKIRRIQ